MIGSISSILPHCPLLWKNHAPAGDYVHSCRPKRRVERIANASSMCCCRRSWLGISSLDIDMLVPIYPPRAILLIPPTRRCSSKLLLCIPRDPRPQISYRVVRTEYQDDFFDSADYGATEQQASTASHTGNYEYDFGEKVALPEKREVELFTCILIVTVAFSTPLSAKSRLQGGDVFSTTTRIATVLTIVDGVEGPTDYATTISVAPNGEAIVRLDLTSFSQISPDSTGLCASCSLTVVAGACLSGDCGDYDMAATNENVKVQSAVSTSTVV